MSYHDYDEPEYDEDLDNGDDGEFYDADAGAEDDDWADLDDEERIWREAEQVIDDRERYEERLGEDMGAEGERFGSDERELEELMDGGPPYGELHPMALPTRPSIPVSQSRPANGETTATNPPQVRAPEHAPSGCGWWYERFKDRKGLPCAKRIEVRVVGVTYENRQTVVANLSVNEEVWLRREPTNPHDKNAVAIWRTNGQQIGYLAREDAAQLASTLDKLDNPLSAVVTARTGDGTVDRPWGVRISFTPRESISKPTTLDADPDDCGEV